MTLWLSILLQGAVLFASLLLLGWWFNRRLHQQQLAFVKLEQRLQQALSQQQHSQHEVEELRAGIIGVGQRVLVIQEQQQRLQQDAHKKQSSVQPNSNSKSSSHIGTKTRNTSRNW